MIEPGSSNISAFWPCLFLPSDVEKWQRQYLPPPHRSLSMSLLASKTPPVTDNFTYTRERNHMDRQLQDLHMYVLQQSIKWHQQTIFQIFRLQGKKNNKTQHELLQRTAVRISPRSNTAIYQFNYIWIGYASPDHCLESWKKRYLKQSQGANLMHASLLLPDSWIDLTAGIRPGGNSTGAHPCIISRFLISLHFQNH